MFSALENEPCGVSRTLVRRIRIALVPTDAQRETAELVPTSRNHDDRVGEVPGMGLRVIEVELAAAVVLNDVPDFGAWSSIGRPWKRRCRCWRS